MAERLRAALTDGEWRRMIRLPNGRLVHCLSIKPRFVSASDAQVLRSLATSTRRNPSTDELDGLAGDFLLMRIFTGAQLALNQDRIALLEEPANLVRLPHHRFEWLTVRFVADILRSSFHYRNICSAGSKRNYLAAGSRAKGERRDVSLCPFLCPCSFKIDRNGAQRIAIRGVLLGA